MALLISALTTLVWWGSVAAPFHYDDQRTVQYNADIRDLGNLPAFVRGLFNRGLLKIGYAINYSLGGKEADGSPTPRSFHLVNVGLHSLNAALALGLTLVVLHRARAEPMPEHGLALAAAAALLFAVHPIHGMAVCLVASRAVLQAATFSMLSLLLLLWATAAGRPPGQRLLLLGGSLVAFVCALGSKSVAVATVGLAVVLLWTLSPKELSPQARRRFGRLAVAALATAAAIAVFLGAEVWQRGYHGVGINLLTQAGVMAQYLGLLFWPGRLSVEHDVALVTSLSAWGAWLPVLLMAALSVAGLVLVLRRRLLGLCLAWFLVALAPTSSLVPRVEQMVEYRTYPAVLGFAGAGVWLICRAVRLLAVRWRAGPQATTVLAGALCGLAVCGLAARTLSRHSVYADPIALWTDAAAKAPHRPRPAFNLGASLASAGRHAEALPHLRRAADLQPHRPDAHLVLGRSYTAVGNLDEATVHLLRAERLLAELPATEAKLAGTIRPALAKELWNQGNRLSAVGRNERAAELYRGAIRCNPYRAEAYHNLGVVLTLEQRYRQAVDAWRAGLERTPDDVEMLAELAWQLAACPDGLVRDGAEAVRLAERAVALVDPATAELLDLLAAAYAQAGRFQEAISTADRAAAAAQADGRDQLARSIRARRQWYAEHHTPLQPP